MNHKSLLPKLCASLSSRWLMLLMMVMLTSLAASAAEAYACYTSSDQTLTFYYDNNRSSRTGTTYDMNTGYSTPAWFLDTHETLQAVTFDATFKNARPTSTYSWFYIMPNLRRINNIGNLNTSSVTVMQNMFNGCSALYYLDLSNFNTANVTDMSLMFCDCSNLTVIDLSSFNTSKVTSMGSMFQDCSNLTTIYAGSGWTTAAVTNSGFMFRNCTSLVGGQGTTYQSSTPVNMAYAHIDGGPSNPGFFTDGSAPMPYACYTSSNKTLTFYYDTQRHSRTGTTYFMNTRDIRTGWYIDELNANVTKVVFNPSFADARPTSLYLWFYEMSSLQSIQGINYLNTSEVTNMAFTFCNCEKLTSLDLSHFNTDKVTTMQYMFIDCPKLTSLDLSGFNTANVTDMEGMFSDCHNLTTIYAGSGWSTDAVTAANTVYMFADCYSLVGGKGTAYDDNHMGKEYAHIDGGPSDPGYFTAGTEAYACYTPSNTTMTFYYDNLRHTRTGTTFALNTGATFPAWFDGNTNENVTKVVFDPSFADARPTSTHGWFDEMYSLTSVQGTENLNTSEVTDMAVMFGDCGELTAVDVSHFDTRKVTTMAYMFYYCSALTSLDVCGFDTGNVTDMSGMFEACAGLTYLDVTNFNTGNVTDTYGMFEDCDGLTSLDLGNFNTSRVTDMRHMFSYCDKLRTIYVGNGWSTAAVTSSDYMFYESPSLVGGQGTTYDENHIDKAYAHIDGGESNPGYFTDAYATMPYACYTPDNTTLTFYCDNQRRLRLGTTYNLNTGFNEPDWYIDDTYKSVTQAVFDPSFADALPTSTHRWFLGMDNLLSISGMEHLNTSQVTNMTWMFYGCSGLTSLDLSNFNTSQVTNMTWMFYGCSGLTSLDLSNFNTSQVTKFVGMFKGCENLTRLDLSNFNTSQATDFGSMFEGCKNLKRLDLSNFNTSQVTDMSFMFTNCSSLTSLDLSNFDTSKVTNMRGMFYNCSGLANLDVSHFNTSKVTDMTFMFLGCSHLASLDLRNFNTSQVNGMRGMFCNCTGLTSLDLRNFNTSKVPDMHSMFEGCENLTILDLGNFNTSKVTDMKSMFKNCSHLTKIYVGSDWTTDAVTDSEYSKDMFENCTSLVGGMGTTYDENHVDKEYAHIDGGESNPGYFTDANTPRAYACYTPDNTTLTFYCDDQHHSHPGKIYELNTGEDSPGWQKDDTYKNMTQAVFDPSFAEARPTSTHCWFAGKMTASSNLQSITGMEYLNTSQVTTMSYMFSFSGRLTSLDLSHFNTSNVTNMANMFSFCESLTNLDVSNFNTSQVTNMVWMFVNCSGLTSLDLSSFNTSKVTDMYGMFSGCSGLTNLDLSNFNTSQVTNMVWMFSGCSGLTSLDLSNFKTSKVTDMFQMFAGCSNLTTIYAGIGFTTAAVTSSDYMFKECYSLVGGMGTTFDANHVDKAYAHIDGGPSNPGYFSLLGDVNNDGKVDVADVVDLINFILSGDPTGINLKNADVNSDTDIDVADVVDLIDYILN